MISSKELPRIVSSMVGTGNFLPFNEIKSRIEGSGFQERTKNKMLTIIDYLSGRKYSHDLLLDNNMTIRDWVAVLSKFNQINCSPIPVPPHFFAKHYPGVMSWDNPRESVLADYPSMLNHTEAQA